MNTNTITTIIVISIYGVLLSSDIFLTLWALIVITDSHTDISIELHIFVLLLRTFLDLFNG